jgi:hypothetical protein
MGTAYLVNGKKLTAQGIDTVPQRFACIPDKVVLKRYDVRAVMKCIIGQPDQPWYS